jgi:glycine C-acetyltransferase/8-amino-7-oxononanoate synthase
MDAWREELEALKAAGMYRSLRVVDGPQRAHVTVAGRDLLLLCSNNYLGLAAHPALQEAAREAASRYGVGSGASRLVSGSMRAHHQLEEAVAAFKGTEAALLFNSGYAANTGVIQGLFGPDDLIFSDELNHASIVDGCRLARARTVIFPHRDVAALAELMAAEAPRRKGRWLVVTDGVFSMDGDFAPLPELVALKERCDAMLLVDDAHGTGVLGATGRGSAEHFGCRGRIDLQMGTFGKALGCSGAYLAASRTVIEVLVNRSRPFIFSTSLPPLVAAAATTALEIVASPEGAALRRSLRANRTLFADRLQQAGLDLLGSATQIVPVLTGEPQPTMAAAARLFDEGILLQGIRPPTVPAGRCRLRATVMATHRPQELADAAAAIVQAVRGGP